MSKLLPIFRASYYFSALGDLSLLYEAYDFSSQAEKRGVPLESFGRRFSSLRYYTSQSMKFTDDPGACRLSFE